MILTACAVFLAVALVDVCWTLYISKTGEHKAWAAAFWSAMIMVIGSFSTLTWIEDKRMIIPAALGAYVGTVLTVLYNKRKNDGKASQEAA